MKHKKLHREFHTKFDKKIKKSFKNLLTLKNVCGIIKKYRVTDEKSI